MMFKNISMMN